MSDYLYHYTSRQVAQEIVISGKLSPQRSDKLYLTEDSYQVGAMAAARLSILNKAVEVVMAVPRDRVSNLSAERLVESIIGGDGRDLRPGRGMEMWTTTEVDVSHVASWALAWP